MNKATNEKRLEEILAYRLLNVRFGKEYKALARLAASHSGKQSAFISLITDKDQFFIARYGWDTIQIPAKDAICTHTINHPDQVLAVKDVRKEPVLKDLAMVISNPELVSYVGVPLVSAAGIALGTLGMVGSKTQIPPKNKLNGLQALAVQVVKLFELHKVRQEMKEFSQTLGFETRRLNTFLNASQAGTWEFDLASGAVNVNKRWAAMIGKAPEVSVTMGSWYRNMHPMDKATYLKTFQQLFGKGFKFHPDSGEPVIALKRKLAVEKLETISEGLESGIWKTEYRLMRDDGTHLWVEEIGHIIQDEKGRPVRLTGVTRDKTGSKLEEIRIKSQQQIDQFFKKDQSLSAILREVLQHLAEMGEFRTAEIWLAGKKGRHMHLVSNYAQDKKAELFYKAGALYAKAAKKEGLAGSIWANQKIEIWDRIDENTTFKRRDAAKKAGLKSVIGLPLIQNQKTIGVLIFCSDKPAHEIKNKVLIYETLSSLLGTEIKRKQQEEEMSLLFKSAPEILAIASPDGYFSKVNPAFCHILGFSELELTSQPFKNFIHPDDLTKTMTEYQETITGKRYAEGFINRYRTKTGYYRWISWNSSDIFGEDKEVFAFGRDVTEIKELQNLLDNATRLSRVGGWEIDIAANSVYWSAMTKEIHEVPKTFNPDMASVLQFYRADVQEKMKIAFDSAIEKGQAIDIEIPIVTAKGNERWIRILGHSEFFKGQCVRLYGSMQDIHDRKATELRLQSTADNIPGVIFQYVIHPDGTDEMLHLTKGAINLWGYTAAECMANTNLIWDQTKAGGDYEMVQASIMESAANLTRWQCEYRSRLPDGRILWHEGIGTPQKLLDGSVIWDSIVIDITQKKEFERLLSRASEMARIGSWELDLLNMDGDTMYWSSMTKIIHEVDENYVPLRSKSFDYYEAESKDNIQLAIDNLIKKGEDFDLELLITTAKGNERWIRCIGQSDRAGKKCTRIYGSIQDIHDRKLTELELAKKSELLAVISKVISLLLQTENWNDILWEVIEMAGNAVEVDRVFYFENHTDPVTGENLCSQLQEWSRGSVSPQIDNPELQNVPITAFQEFFTPLSKGKSYSAVVSYLPRSELRSMLESQGIRSILVLPVIISGRLYGFMGFDDCTREREWRGSEISFLHTVTSNLSAAIQRRNGRLELQKALEERNNILESIGDGFCAIDQSWNVTYWNYQAEKILGIKRAKIVGKNIWNYFGDVKELSLYKKVLHAMEQREVVHIEDYYPALQKWFDLSVYPSENGISVFFKDISTRKNAEIQLLQSNERFEQVSYATNDAIWDWDIVNDQLYLGSGFETAFAYKQDRTTTHATMDQYIHPQDKEAVVNSIQQTLNDRNITNWQQEYRYKRGDDSYAFVIDRGVITRNVNGEAIRMVGAMTDISYRKEYEDSLRYINNQLESRAKELAISNAELEQFAYVASHDLQEPLRMVTSFLTQLEKKYGDALDEKALKYIAFAVDGAKRMRQIILDLLEFSRIGKHDDKLELIALNEIIDEVVQNLNRQIENRNVKLQIGKMPKIYSYRTPLVQVFQNLIANAIKYTHENVQPEVHIKSQKQGDEWLISIRDNGIGIEAEYFDKIFVIFQRLHNKEEYSGTGMGLATVKKNIEFLGGKIWVESTPGTGSTFYFTLKKKTQ